MNYALKIKSGTSKTKRKLTQMRHLLKQKGTKAAQVAAQVIFISSLLQQSREKNL